MTDIDPTLKSLIEANSAALADLLTKIAAGDQDVTEEIARLSATDADLKAAISPVPEAPAAPAD